MIPNFFNQICCKEWQELFGLHLVLVTLHGQFITNIEQDKQNWRH